MMPLPQSEPTGVKVPGLVRERAYSKIRDAILAGKLKPDERLDDADLQRWLGMSRTPIRQALLALTAEGFVETAPQSHTRVAKARAEDASAYLQTVGVLVTGMTLLAATVMTPGQRAELVSHLDRAVEAIDQEDRQGFIAQVTQYYTGLTAVCPNPFLVRLVEQSAKGLGFNLVVAFGDLSIDWPAVRVQYEALARSLREGASGSSVEEATRRIFALPTVYRTSDISAVRT